ncbi:hypothetical protein Tco_0677011 [Tanacetum coccineum]
MVAVVVGEFNHWRMNILTSSKVDDVCSERVLQGLNDMLALTIGLWMVPSPSRKDPQGILLGLLKAFQVDINEHSLHQKMILEDVNIKLVSS